MKLLPRLILIVLICFAGQREARSQSLFDDAKELSNYFDVNGNLDHNESRVWEILDKYYQPYIPNTSSQLKQAYDRQSMAAVEPNPFINLSGQPQSTGDSREGTSFNLEDGLTKLGTLPVTTIADGAAQFLIERAKQELEIAYFQRFKKVLTDSSEFETLFPTTIEYLSVLKVEEISSMLNALKSAFNQDIRNLPEHAIDLEKLPKYNELYASNTGKLIKTGLLLVKPIEQGDNVFELLQFLANDANTPLDQLDDNYAAIYSSIKLGNIISESLRSSEEGTIWVRSSELLQFFGDDKQFKLYLGLLYQQTKGETIQIGNNSFSISSELAKADTLLSQLNLYRKAFQEFGDILEDVNSVYNSVAELLKSNNAADLALIREHTMSLITLVENSGNLTEQFFDTTGFNQQLITFSKQLNRALSIAEHLRSKNYTASLVELGILFSALEIDKKLMDDFIKYGSFMAAMAEAGSADDIQSILENHVLPPTSYRTKRISASSITINAYLGAFGGLDIETENYQPSPSFGMWAPIGPAFTFSTSKKDASNTFYISLIDLGAVTSYRLNDTKESLPELQLQNIISPGVFYIRGIRNSPISWHIGAQYGPNLREIADGVEAASYRVHAGISVDIPLFNLRVIPKN